ncbi:MAG: NAD(P)/FAD-dependent oxidoreductase [Acidimicrobiia bacterium]|nr:NAD(P)/FAD-dependent oxidoreductase [Acidimicrobiia bacterium]
MSDRAVVVLGGGIGGVVAARRLRQRLDPGARVVLVERDPLLRFAPSFLWVMAGWRTPEGVTADLRRLRRRGIELVEAEVEGVDPDGRAVATTAGPLAYDRLVVALGAELDPEALPGFAEHAHSVYTLDGAAAAGRALQGLDEGRVAVVVSSLPYKCPAAPWEAAFLADAVLRRRGVRERCPVDVYTPEPFPMPTAGPELGAELRAMLEGRGIGVHTERSVQSITGDGLLLAGGEQVPAALTIGVPPHRAPRPVRDSSLAGPTGFVPVDPATLATDAEGVSAIGDVTAIPIAGGKMLPKAGVFAEGEADVVARRLADELHGRVPTAEFDGRGSCFVELGGHRAAFATGRFYGGGRPRGADAPAGPALAPGQGGVRAVLAAPLGRVTVGRTGIGDLRGGSPGARPARSGRLPGRSP